MGDTLEAVALKATAKAVRMKMNDNLLIINLLIKPDFYIDAAKIKYLTFLCKHKGNFFVGSLTFLGMLIRKTGVASGKQPRF